MDKNPRSSRNLKFVDSAFEDVISKPTLVGNKIYKSSNNLSINGEEDISFDVSQFKLFCIYDFITDHFAIEMHRVPHNNGIFFSLKATRVRLLT